MSRVVVRHAAFLLCSWVGLVQADGEAPPPPPSDNAIPPEPEITITHRGEERVEEYRINNRVYMIKVTPAKGFPYYLIDTTGNGSFDTRRNGLGPKVTVPQWVFFNWK